MTTRNERENGEKTGVACMERAINPCADGRMPSPAINAIYEDGIGQYSRGGRPEPGQEDIP